MKIYDINESYSIVDFSDQDPDQALNIKLEMMDSLSCFVEGYKFMPQYRAGFFDGKKHFFEMTADMNIKIPKGLVETVCLKFGEHLSEPYSPLRPNPVFTMEDLEESITSLNLPFPPYDYQKKAVYIAMNEPRKILVAATGAGKSLILYMMMHSFKRLGLKGLLIVPNIGLAEQMRSDFIDYSRNLPNAEDHVDKYLHLVYGGKEKHFDKPMTISTWQSAIRMAPENFEGLEYVCIDEAHLATGESLQHLLSISENCLYKIGLTGTLPKVYEHRFTLGATLGKSVQIINPQGLIERGLATPVTIAMWYLNYSEDERKRVRGMTYQKEVKFIEEHYARNNFIAKLAISATQKYGNTLMLYNTISHGDLLLKFVLKNKFGVEAELIEKITVKRIQDLIDAKQKADEEIIKIFTLTPITPKDKKVLLNFWTPTEIDRIFDNLSKYNIYLIKGAIEGDVRNEIRGIIEGIDDGIVIATYGTASTGLNIKRLHNIFLCSSTKSSVRLRQSTGRGMRLHDDKDMMRLFDFIDDFSKKLKNGKVQNKNYALKHSYERLESYFSDGFPISEKEIEL